MTDEILHQTTQIIQTNFAQTPYPGDDNIGWGCGSEGYELGKAFRGKHWKELSVELLLQHRWQIPCTTSQGFRFYIPAWMLATFSQYDKLIEPVVFNLSPPIGSDMRDHFLKHVAAFTPQEKFAILTFLQTLRELHPLDYEMELDLLPEELQKLVRAIAFWKSESKV